MSEWHLQLKLFQTGLVQPVRFIHTIMEIAAHRTLFYHMAVSAAQLYHNFANHIINRDGHATMCCLNPAPQNVIALLSIIIRQFIHMVNRWHVVIVQCVETVLWVSVAARAHSMPGMIRNTHQQVGGQHVSVVHQTTVINPLILQQLGFILMPPVPVAI